jgi:hypothetical protein
MEDNVPRSGDCIVIVGKPNRQFGVCKIDESNERNCRSDVATFSIASDVAHAWRDEGCQVWICDAATPDVLKPYGKGK